MVLGLQGADMMVAKGTVWGWVFHACDRTDDE